MSDLPTLARTAITESLDLLGTGGLTPGIIRAQLDWAERKYLGDVEQDRFSEARRVWMVERDEALVERFPHWFGGKREVGLFGGVR